MQREFIEYMNYIWIRYISKRIFDADLDPEVSDEQVAFKFNQMNISNCQNFTYNEITKIVANRLSKKYFD